MSSAGGGGGGGGVLEVGGVRPGEDQRALRHDGSSRLRL